MKATTHFQYLQYTKGFCLICACNLLLTCCNTSKSIAKKEWYSSHKILNLSGKQLHSLPDSVFKFHLLEELYLGPASMVFYGPGTIPEKRNNLQTLPLKICSLKHLKILDLTFNDFSELPDLVNCDSLKELNMALNEKIKVIDNLAKIKAIKQLKYLIVLGTNISPTELAFLRNELDSSIKIIASGQQYIDYLSGKK